MRKLLIIAILLLLASVGLNVYQYKNEKVISDTLIVEHIDTCPKIIEKEVIKYKAYKLPADTSYICDTIHDSIEVILPITQSVYKDSSYTAWVTGFDARLDSIKVRERIVTTVVEKRTYHKFNVGITGGYGFGLKSSRLEPYIGVGISYNILGF